MAKALLAVMMPAFNEERTIEIILGHVLERREVGEVIAVDDGSTDRTWEILSKLAREDSRVRPFKQPHNQGKGAALRRAISELRMPYALVQDADLEYDPAEYAVLIRPIEAGRADVVYGSRFFGSVFIRRSSPRVAPRDSKYTRGRGGGFAAPGPVAKLARSWYLLRVCASRSSG